MATKEGFYTKGAPGQFNQRVSWAMMTMNAMMRQFKENISGAE
jgi:hypothetical protein